MNNINMAGMNPMGGGPVGAGIPPMMNNRAAAGARPSTSASNNDNQRQQLNTYIYEYFLRNEMYDCARSLIQSGTPMHTVKDSPGANGVDGEVKDESESKKPDDLPMPGIPNECPESCFLFEWWCLFWDMFNAQRGKGDTPAVLQYVNHTNVSFLAFQCEIMVYKC